MRRNLSDKEIERVKHIFKMILETDMLTNWELGYLISIEEQFNKDKKLSDEQLEKLEEVYSAIQVR
jgi:Na+/phosphate symporter